MLVTCPPSTAGVQVCPTYTSRVIDSIPSERPRTLMYAAIALVVAAVGSVVAALSLFGLRGWLLATTKATGVKSRPPTTVADIPGYIHKLQIGQLVAAAAMAAVLVFAAVWTNKGKSQSRWIVVGIFVVATITGSLVGMGSVLSIGTSAPAAFKIPSFIGGLALVVAVVMVNLRPSVQWFAAHKPQRPDRPARPGLFGPRPARAPRPSAAGQTTAPPATAAPSANPSANKARAKVRADEASAAKGAELARNRAKAAKSRKSDG